MSEGQAVTTRARQDDQRMALCPECEELIELPTRAKKGLQIECPACNAQVEVISLKPPELDYAFDNWEDEEH
jgi:lysine biosynthesis protein LysW